MNTSFKLSKTTSLPLAILIVIGVAAVITGFATDPARTWPNVLLNNIFFLTISVGAMMFYSLQYITGSSWSALFQRIPLALGSFIPVAAMLMLIMYFGLQD